MQLSQAEITQQNPQKYLISGTVDFSTVPYLMQCAQGFFKAHKKSASGQSATEKNAATITTDLSHVTGCNSAGLALLLEMIKHARLNDIELHFENLPDTLLTIAKAYGVESEIRDICK
ncbi:MAG: STAS domain-containing protein [Gammaproteobacteria bacterium]|nr:STAS domain-containing protein [Gammaproteobacteria bacterium]